MREKDKLAVVAVATRLASLGFRLLATEGTAEALQRAGLPVERVFKVNEGIRPHIVDRMKNGEVALVVNTPVGRSAREDSYLIRRTAVTLGIPHFTIPVTMKEAARFIGLQLKAMHPEKGSVLIGYNSAGPQADLHLLMKPYHRYCDYVGIDIYVGCFSNVGGYLWFFDLMLRYLWAYTRKPLLLQEFGYIGGGEAKSKREKEAILRAYGVRTPQEAKDNILSFVEKLPRRLREHVEKVGGGDPSRYYGLLFRSDLNNHLYRELPRRTHIPGYPHTPQGQADFYRDILPRLYRLPYLCGAFIYCYSDAERCYICGQEDCPTETRWGLVDCAGREKPSYFSVRDAFGLMG